MSRPPRLDLDAGGVAARALGFLAADPDRLGRFFALSGLDPSNVRAAAAEPSFLPAVLDHVLADEDLLVAFAETEALAPETVGEARRLLGGPTPDPSL